MRKLAHLCQSSADHRVGIDSFVEVMEKRGLVIAPCPLYMLTSQGWSLIVKRDLMSIVLGLHFLSGCGPQRPPPPNRSFNGLPLSGSIEFARRLGFTSCFNIDAISMRCRRSGVMIEGQGPYSAGVDLVGSDGRGGFDQLTLWHEHDQIAVQSVGDTLQRLGWKSCMTALPGINGWGDQEIYARKGIPVKFSIDISYWGKRRLRLIPASVAYRLPCPDSQITGNGKILPVNIKR